MKMSKNGKEPVELEGLGGLMVRAEMIKFAIRYVRSEGDPHGVIDKYIDQQKQINAMIREHNQKHRTEPKPEPVVIKLKTAYMKAEGLIVAEGDATVYNHMKEQLLLGNIDLVNDVINMILVGPGYAFSPDGNQSYNDATITGNEITAVGYTAKGKALAGKTVTQDDGNDRAMYDASDVTWTSLATTSITNAILIDDTVTAPVADPLLIRFEIATNSNGGNYQLAFNAATGIALLN
jgi:hypothetical protein